MRTKLITIGLFLSACNLFVSPPQNEPRPTPQVEPTLTRIEATAPSNDDNMLLLSIDEPPTGSPAAFQIFAKYINVFGVNIYATEDVPDAKLLHAAGVMAQYLDNDEDGLVDNELVIEAMQANQATLIMFTNEQEIEQSGLFDVELPDDIILQDLYASETHPNGAEQGRFDAALEEVLHLITHAGYAIAYPDIFREEPGSQLADAMDIARGGQFLNNPSSYPAGVWYSYDDPTCEYDCQITEYIYWALTSLLGGQDFSGRLEEIEHEWQLNTADKVQQGDPDVYALLTNPQYAFPTRLPDGDYVGLP